MIVLKGKEDYHGWRVMMQHELERRGLWNVTYSLSEHPMKPKPLGDKPTRAERQKYDNHFSDYQYSKLNWHQKSVDAWTMIISTCHEEIQDSIMKHPHGIIAWYLLIERFVTGDREFTTLCEQRQNGGTFLEFHFAIKNALKPCYAKGWEIPDWMACILFFQGGKFTDEQLTMLEDEEAKIIDTKDMINVLEAHLGPVWQIRDEIALTVS